MGKHSERLSAKSDQLDGRPLSWFDEETARCLKGYQLGGTSQGRKAFVKRLLWIEAERERQHGIGRPVRSYNSE